MIIVGDGGGGVLTSDSSSLESSSQQMPGCNYDLPDASRGIVYRNLVASTNIHKDIV